MPGGHAGLTLPNSNAQGFDTSVGRGGAGQVGNDDSQSQSGATGDNHDSDSSGTDWTGQTGPLGGSDPIFTAGNRQGDGPLLAATPEFDSLALMGTGMVAWVAMSLLRLRGVDRIAQRTDASDWTPKTNISSPEAIFTARRRRVVNRDRNRVVTPASTSHQVAEPPNTPTPVPAPRQLTRR